LLLLIVTRTESAEVQVYSAMARRQRILAAFDRGCEIVGKAFSQRSGQVAF